MGRDPHPEDFCFKTIQAAVIGDSQTQLGRLHAAEKQHSGHPTPQALNIDAAAFRPKGEKNVMIYTFTTNKLLVTDNARKKSASARFMLPR